jgi:4'-phosphopantetheinyl transferase
MHPKSTRPCCLIVRIFRKVDELYSARKYLKVVRFRSFPVALGNRKTKVPKELIMIGELPTPTSYSPMSNDWKKVDALPPLEAGEVQLWRIDLGGTTELHDRFAALLTSTEQSHANRYRPGRVQEHFSVGRACLRILLGNALGLNPLSLTITAGVHGKPELQDLNGDGISFNVAHAGDTILIALARSGLVGVDVEYFDRTTDTMEVAQANFTESEIKALSAIIDPQIRLKTFYLYWTRKEAVLKADGRGLIASLSSFDVSLPSLNHHPVHISESLEEQGKLFYVSDLSLGVEAAAAIALESSDHRITQLIFPLNRSW